VSGGRYEILRPIASGGMATVYLGHAHGPDGSEKPVAIKVMHAQLAQDQHFVDMFMDEVRVAMRIRHPNVVATLDLVDSEEVPYLVMDLVEGVTLHDIFHIPKRAPIGAPIALRILIDLLSGLHAAHELADADGKPLELVHRDVSPQNILIGLDGVTKITDFGIAWASSRVATTRTGEVKGKVIYMSAEQVHGGRVDRRADVYSAGLVMWELFTGKRHFQNEHEAVMVFAQSRGAKATLRSEVPDVPEDLDEVCMRALGFAPGDRYATALAFATALEGAAKAADVRIASHVEVAQLVAAVSVRVDEERRAAASRRAARSRVSARRSSPDLESRDSSLSPDAGEPSSPSLTSAPDPLNPFKASREDRRSAPSIGSLGTPAPAMIAMTPPPPSRSWARWAIAVLVVGALLGLLALGGSEPEGSSSPASSPPATSGGAPVIITATAPTAATAPATTTAVPAQPTTVASASATARATAAPSASPARPRPSAPASASSRGRPTLFRPDEP
jgi:eukaryotic-like serine/threonine-protein kinase